VLRIIARPSPVRPEDLEREGSTRKNRSKTLGSASAGIPVPVSETSIRIASPSVAAAIVTGELPGLAPRSATQV
jgi:hypothetical protein